MMWPKMNNKINWQSLLIALAALLWAADALWRQPLLGYISPSAVVFWEHTLALFFVIPIIWLNRDFIKQLSVKHWLGFAYLGIMASALATLAFTMSFSYVGPSVAILLQKFQPIFTFILASILLQEKLPNKFWWWAGLALVGGYIISFPNFVPELTLYQNGWLGVGLALLAALLWGSATVVGRALVSDLNNNLVTAGRFLLAWPVLAIILYWQQGLNFASGLEFKQWSWLIFITIGPGFGAMYLYYLGLKKTKATMSALLELIWPLAAVVLNWIFLHEQLSLIQWVGAFMMLIAISRLTIWPQKIVEV